MTQPASVPVSLPRSLCWDVRPGGDPARTIRAFLAWPEQPPPPAGYPVLVVLDATTLFGTAVEAARLQANRPGATGVEPAVILGLGHPGDRAALTAGRRRDYTPPPWDEAAGTGGADALLHTLHTLVLPQASRQVPIDHNRLSLFGHSLGGLLALHALLGRQSGFASFVAASPSLWWNDRILPRRARDFAAAGPAPGCRLLLTVGGAERPAASLAMGDPARAARQEQARMVESVHELAACLAPVLDVRCIEFADENHGSVLPAAISRAIPFALSRPPAVS